MSNRIEQTFARTKLENRAALIPFIMGGDPSAKISEQLLSVLPTAGADLIEIGMPFSDPMADGPAIQAAGLRALKAGTNIHSILALVKHFRAKHETPIILMGYYNPVYRYGPEKFCADAAAAGVDGLILVDLPPEEEDELTPYLLKHDLKLIRLIAPTSGKDRTELLTRSASGFVYYISVRGITGAKSADMGELKSEIDALHSMTALPVAVGFGIKTPQQVKEISAFADAVVVGSALVDVMAKAKDPVKEAAKFVQELAKGLKR